MNRSLVLLILCISQLFVLVSTSCTVSKYEEAFGDRIKCTNVTLQTALNQTSSTVTAVVIFQSQIRQIGDDAFANHSRTLVSLNLHDCGILDIKENAFRGLTSLRKLSLPNNKIREVKAQWFSDLISLQQLDLSYNQISMIDPIVFSRLARLQRLDVSENRLVCLDAKTLEPLRSLDKLRFAGNPLTLSCRAKLTLWLRDVGVNYKSNPRGPESWLDNVLWYCSIEDYDLKGNQETLMQHCVIVNLFNQLGSALTNTDSYPLSVSDECVHARQTLTKCLATHSEPSEPFTYGKFVSDLLLHLRDVKST